MSRCTCGDNFVYVTGAHAADCPVVKAEPPKYDTTEASFILSQARIRILEQEIEALKAGRESPEQAWFRGASLMRDLIQTHGKLADDDPAWGIEVPEYRAP